MNYYDNIIINKNFISKKNFYCLNCNKRGHVYKYCNESIISNGIISFHIKDITKQQIQALEIYLKSNLSTIKLNNKNVIDLDKDIINKNIKFLMVQRRNSLGYIEFMRGRYNLKDLKSIKILLEQMSASEILDINTKDFDDLWNNLWNIDNIKNKNHHKEYIISKQKFIELKKSDNDLFKDIILSYDFNEWGFPKGRREMYESDLICAIREFEEETNYTEDMYTIFENCKPIRENLIGTNGINYAHNYYLAILNRVSEDIFINNEIGDLRLMTIDECIEVIRPYHHNKYNIIIQLYMLINNFLTNSSS
jgi:hypothetical protein